ncbi:hypothetical protein DLAC_08918 [Tieghemostelium lacteum]|uniref:Actin maturation protease n=1 Tax=Tieghemostelium lacteum TaxID=361077 RepID=A0A151Z8P7_TIELA|nr:hypothetical protein DLAC_08918 [Tieghemostelium lacteum]|eukprot:KYQ90316.1 hypothetical protein DLAC_08918 [Tieghemostelium lacteum]
MQIRDGPKLKLQNGYNCGLVALRMVIEYLRGGASLTKEQYDQMLTVSIERGYSKQGEMFSSYNLSILSNDLFSHYADSEVIVSPSLFTVLHHLSKGLPILIPYDADSNWRPTSKTNGKRAHWAIIFGFVIPKINSTDRSSNENISKVQFESIDTLQQSDRFIYLNSNIIKFRDSDNCIEITDSNYSNRQLFEITESDVFLICQHSKSKFVQLWEYSLLKESNESLKTPNMDKQLDKDSWIIPTHLEDLQNKWIFFSNTQQ